MNRIPTSYEVNVHAGRVPLSDDEDETTNDLAWEGEGELEFNTSIIRDWQREDELETLDDALDEYEGL